MRPARLTTYVLLLLLVLVSCNNNPSSSHVEDSLSETTSAYPTTTNHDTSASTSVMSETTTETSTPTSEVVTLKDKTKAFHSNSMTYGNTNGNANNRGLAVFNHRAKVHYYAVGRSVYEYQPTTDNTTLLFTNDDTGYITNLCLLDNDLYYVTTTNQFLFRYNLLTFEKTLVYEYETSAVYGYYKTIFLYLKKIYYSETPVLGIGTYNHDNKEATTKFMRDVTTINIMDTKVIYTENYGPTLSLMADSLMGKTNITYFSSAPFGFDELKAVHLYAVSNDSPSVLTFALLLRKGTDTSLYLYNNGDQDLVEISEGDDIHSINSDGEYVYFIKGQSLYRYHVVNATLSLVHDLYTNAMYVQVINHWLYVSNTTLSTLYRIDPDTGFMNTDFWISA